MAAAKFNKDGGVFVKQYGKKIPLEIQSGYGDQPEKAIARAEAFITRRLYCLRTTMMSGSSMSFEKNKLPAITSW